MDYALLSHLRTDALDVNKAVKMEKGAKARDQSELESIHQLHSFYCNNETGGGGGRREGVLAECLSV